MRTLAPTTDILQTAIQSGMTHIDAVSEFVDNSFGEAAGNADEIWIMDCGDGTLFLDRGRGVGNINLLFRLGDGESRNSRCDIGRFGVGSKFGALTFGTHVTVKTVCAGKYHEFTVDWASVLSSGVWPDEYCGKGRPAKFAPPQIQKGGTIIIIKNLHPGRQRPTATTYMRRLGIRFNPALQSGKNIYVIRASSIANALRGKFSTRTSVREEFSDYLRSRLKGKLRADVSIAGKKAVALFGEIKDGERSLTGIHLTYGGRVIQTLEKLNGERLPAKMFGQVDLSTDWKESLSFNKTVITDGLEELESVIADTAGELIKELNSAEQGRILEKLSAEISNMIDKNFGRKLIRAIQGKHGVSEDTGGWQVDEEDDQGEIFPGPNPGPGPTPDPHPRPRTIEKLKEKIAGDGHDPRGSFEFDVQPGYFGVNGKAAEASLLECNKRVVCSVRLNRDIEVINEVLKGAPGNAPSVFLLCAKALASYIALSKDWLPRLLGEEKADSITQMEMLERADVAYDYIMQMTRISKS